MRPQIAVIGGGISGLAAAFELTEVAPHVDVLLLESQSRLGGLLHTVERDGFLIEAAADNFITDPSAAVELCHKVGLEESMIAPNPVGRQAFVVGAGRLHPIPTGFMVMAPSRIRPMITSKVLSLRGKLRVALEYVLPRSVSDADESLAAFVRRRFGREMFERLVQPLVGSIFAADPERLSINATMPHFRQMEREHGSLIRAALRQQRNRPAESCSGARYGKFAALRSGMSTLVNALSKRLPPQSIQLASPVDQLAPLDHGWLLSIGGDHPRRLRADGVVLATPAYRAAKLTAGVDPLLSKQLAEIEYASCAVVSLGYHRAQIRHPLNGFGFVVPLAEERNIFSCSFASVKYAGRARSDSVLLRVFIGGACQAGLLHLSNEELAELASLEVGELLQIRGAPIMRHVTRHNRAMAQYHVGHRNRVANINRCREKFPTLTLAGSAYCGVGVPACIRSGQAAAQQVLSGLKIISSSSSLVSVGTETVA
jgi:oxygen-dependent protoporphyrinogen oxidase